MRAEICGPELHVHVDSAEDVAVHRVRPGDVVLLRAQPSQIYPLRDVLRGVGEWMRAAGTLLVIAPDDVDLDVIPAALLSEDAFQPFIEAARERAHHQRT